MSTINTEIKKRLTTAMNGRRENILKFMRELKSEGFTEHDYTCPFIRWEDCERFFGSCWGTEIADLAAFVCQEGVFCLMKGDDPVAIDDPELTQAIKRAQIIAEAGTTVHKKICSNTVNAYVVQTDKGLLVFDYSGTGSVNCFNDPVTDWVLMLSDFDLAVTDEIRAACDKAIETCEAQRVEVDDSTSTRRLSHTAYCIPDKATGRVSLFNFVEGQTLQVEKKKTLTLRNFDEESTDKVADVSEELFKCYNAMFELKNKTSIFAGPNGETCVVLPEIRSRRLAYYCINLGGAGKHITAEYSEGFNLPVFAIRSENMNETVVKVPLHKFKVVMTTPDGKDPKMIMLYDMLKSVGAYGKHAGLDDGIDMALEKDKEEWFTLRIQSYICPGGDKIELFERLYSYSSTDHKPTTLVTYHTGFGTSFYTPTSAPLKIQPNKYDEATGELSAFNLSVVASDKKAGDMDTYRADENQKNLSEGFAMATPIGPLGFPKLANATFMCQWPVHAPEPPQTFCSMTTEPVYLAPGCLDDGLPVYRSLAANMPVGDLMASKTGFGSYQGRSTGVAVGDLTRRNSAGTGTFSLIFSIQPKAGETRDLLPGEFTVSKDDLKPVIKMMDSLLEIAGKAVQIFDEDADVCVDAPKKREKTAADAQDGPLAKTPRHNVGVITAPAMVEVAM